VRLGHGLVAILGCAGLLASSEARAACAGRPTDPGGYQGYTYGDAEVRSFATAQVRVHYATSGTHAPVLDSTRPDGVPDTVAFAAETAEDALARYAQLGFRKVPSDAACASNGGDGKLDVYLVRFAGADGATVPECEGATCSSFLLVESTFRSKGYASAEEGFRTVVAHEIFHAIQNAYRPRLEPFWAEGTAQWGMKTLFPVLEDFERHLPAFFSDSGRSIDAPPAGVTAGFLYGSAVWPLFLSLSHGPETIREILELQAAGQDAIPAADAVLATKGSSLAEAFPMFAAWNAGTGELPSVGGYPDAAKYPGIRIAKLAEGVEGITSGLSYFAYRGKLEDRWEIALETDPSRNAGVLVPIEDGVARLDRAERLPADAEGEVLVVVAGITTKKTDAKYVIRFREPGTTNTSPSDGATAPPSSGGEDDGCNVARGARHPASSRGTFAIACAVVASFAALRSRRKRG